MVRIVGQTAKPVAGVAPRVACAARAAELVKLRIGAPCASGLPRARAPVARPHSRLDRGRIGRAGFGGGAGWQDAAESTDPIDPIDPTDPIDPIDPIYPFESFESFESFGSAASPLSDWPAAGPL